MQHGGGSAAPPRFIPFTSQFTPKARQYLVDWFTQFGQNPMYEIEARIKGVTEVPFGRVVASLMSNKDWSSEPVKVDSTDLMHATRVRETRVGQQRTFIRKERAQDDIYVTTPTGYDVRFQCATERDMPADATPIHQVRYKQRMTFVHKGLFKFELTRVKEGPNERAAWGAEDQFEIEVEYCGQSTEHASRPEYLADSLLMKVSDLLRQLTTAPQDGEVVRLREGTEVALMPSGQGLDPPFGGELPAELATSMQWSFSHMEPDGRACVASLPAAIGSHRYPLYYFCGTVPVPALIRRTATA